MRTRNGLRSWCFTLTAVVSLYTTLARADADVYIRISGFSPSSVSISPGDVVWFTVADDNGPYTVSSPTGAWTPWYLFDYGDSFGIQFNERGDYPYYDAFTFNQGIVHVGTGATNMPPSLTIDSPADGAVLTAPASFSFAVTASDPDNGPMDVEFYVGADLVNTLYAEPFSTPVTDLAVGNYTLTAIAYDYAYATATKSVTIAVQDWAPPTITLSQPSLVSGQFRFEASGLTVGKQVVLQSSTGLGSSANWTSLETNVVTTATASFTKPAVAGYQFFRILQLP